MAAPPTDSRYMGYYSASTGWEIMDCSGSNEYYTESASAFGCPSIKVGCTSTPAPSGSASIRGMIYDCTSSDFSCLTQRLHSTFPPQVPDRSEKTRIVCGRSWSAFDLYRISPSTATPTPVVSTKASSTPSPVASNRPSHPTSPPTSTPSTASQTSTAIPPQPVSPGVIVGATVAGVAVLLVLGFLIWFFGVHRRKAAAQLPKAYPYPPSTWQQPAQQPIYEASSKSVPVQQAQPGIWAHQNTYDVGELESNQHSGR